MSTQSNAAGMHLGTLCHSCSCFPMVTDALQWSDPPSKEFCPLFDHLNTVLRTSAVIGAKVKIGMTSGELLTQLSLYRGIK